MSTEGFFIMAGILAVAILGFFAGAFCGYWDGEKSGYIRCLQDMKQGKSPAYVLVEQANGTTKWESNKEQGK